MIRNALALTLLAVAAFAAEVPLLSFVPADAKTLGGMHVDRTLSSPFGQFLLSQINDNEKDFQEFVNTTGLDPRRDIREVLMAGADDTRKNGVVIARGVFNGPRILAAAQSKGGVMTSYKGIPVAASKDGQWLTVFDGSIAAMGQQALVQYAIDRRASSTVPTTALARKASALAARYDAWLVAAGPITANAKAPGAPALAGILETSGGVEFGATVRMSGEALTRSDKDAQALVDIVRFLTTMLQNNSQNNPDVQRLQAVLNSLDVRAEGPAMKFSMAIPQADLEQLMKPMKAKAAQASR